MTIFCEYGGARARAVLEALAEACAQQGGWLGGRLLRSAEQPGLHLLVSEWQGEGKLPAVPEGVRVWRFIALEEASTTPADVGQESVTP